VRKLCEAGVGRCSCEVSDQLTLNQRVRGSNLPRFTIKTRGYVGKRSPFVLSACVLAYKFMPHRSIGYKSSASEAGIIAVKYSNKANQLTLIIGALPIYF
jgi:hypothetical protein